MDDQALTHDHAPRTYRCPGQAYTIDRAVHVARLAAFYPGCLECEHRADAPELTPLQVRDWAEVERRARGGPRWAGEGIEGAACGDIDAEFVRRVAGALGVSLWRNREASAGPPTVLVGSDGSWTSADFVPAACEVLQTAGCKALETGAVTSSCLAYAAQHVRAEAALWVGNASGRAHASCIKLWHEAGRPSSSPGALDRVLAEYGAPHVRPKRGGGGLERCDAAAVYVPTLTSLYHGLRPLVFVLDTTCHPLEQYWRKLSLQTACRTVCPTSHRPESGPVEAEHDVFSERRATIAREVLTAQAHFGVWISGDGEVCKLVDERGAAVDGELLLLALCGCVCRTHPGVGVVLEPDASDSLLRAVERLGARVIRGEPTRQGMCELMTSSGAVLGGGASGRFWVAGPPAMSDALWCLSLLVSHLSQSDRPLSEVLDGARAAG